MLRVEAPTWEDQSGQGLVFQPTWSCYLGRPIRYRIPYLLHQTPLSNCHRTYRRAEQNSRYSRIVAVANIRVACAHVNKLCDLIEWQYQNMQSLSIHYRYSTRELSGEVVTFVKAQKAINVGKRKRIGGAVQVPLCSKAAVHGSRSWKAKSPHPIFFFQSYKMGFLLITWSLINATLNQQPLSNIEATQNCVMK